MSTVDSENDKDLPLREDIRFLGRMLGDTLREQEGDHAFELVENIRQTEIRQRDTLHRKAVDTCRKCTVVVHHRSVEPRIGV